MRCGRSSSVWGFDMKRLTLETLPPCAVYLGAENADGTLYEQTANLIECAALPAFVVIDGCKVYFDLEGQS